MSQKRIDLQNDPVKETFHRYLIPAIVGMVIKSLYIIMDSIFIGRGVGPDGLGSISIAIPVFIFMTAIAIMIGVGGSTVMSIEFGKGNHGIGQRLLTQSTLLTIVLMAVLTLTRGFWLQPGIAYMGATGNIADLSYRYLDIILQYSVFYALGLMLSCFVRNDTNPRLTMYAMSFSALANIVFNYLFIFVLDWGIEGAAYGTVASYITMLALLLIHFMGGFGQLRFNLRGVGVDQVRKILTTGLPTFFIESSATATALIFNLILLARGDLYITAYSIVQNTSALVIFSLLGIGMACQPIISFNHGAGAFDKVRQTLTISIRYAVVTGVAAVIIVLIWSNEIAGFFTVDHPELIALASGSMKLYYLAYPFMGLNLIVATLFQAIGRSTSATVLSITRGFVLVVAGLSLMPVLMPENGVWLGILFAEVVTLFFSLVLLRKYLTSEGQQ